MRLEVYVLAFDGFNLNRNCSFITFLKFRFGVLVGLKLYVRADEINLIFVK